MLLLLQVRWLSSQGPQCSALSEEYNMHERRNLHFTSPGQHIVGVLAYFWRFLCIKTVHNLKNETFGHHGVRLGLCLFPHLYRAQPGLGLAGCGHSKIARMCTYYLYCIWLPCSLVCRFDPQRNVPRRKVPSDP